MSDLEKLMRDRVVARATPGRRWYDISNADGTAGDTAVLRIYDEISWFGIDADQFARDLAGVTTAKIELQINSPGGSVFDGVAIYNALRAHSAHVTTRVDGVAASIASVIAQAGDHRTMMSGARLMIHEASGIAIGNAKDMRDFADLLESTNETIAEIYASRSGKEAAEFADILASGTDHWMSAQQSVEMGLADEVLDPAPKGASAKAEPATLDFAPLLDALDRVNAALAAQQTPPANQPKEQTEDTVSEVPRDEAERLLASLSFNKEA